MSLYALVAYNRTFSRAGALSPSLNFNENQLIELIKNARLNPDTQLYMDYGTEEFKYEKYMPRIYRRFVNELLRKRVSVTSRIVPGGTHSEGSWEKQLPFLIHTLIY